MYLKCMELILAAVCIWRGCGAVHSLPQRSTCPQHSQLEMSNSQGCQHNVHRHLRSRRRKGILMLTRTAYNRPNLAQCGGGQQAGITEMAC